MEIWSRFCRVPRFFWCFDFFQNTSKNHSISLYSYYIPRVNPWNRTPYMGSGSEPIIWSVVSGVHPWNMEIWRYGAGFAGFPGFLVFWFFFRIPPKVTLYLYIPIFQGWTPESALHIWNPPMPVPICLNTPSKKYVWNSNWGASLRKPPLGGSAEGPFSDRPKTTKFEFRQMFLGGQASASLRSEACGGSIFRPTKNH